MLENKFKVDFYFLSKIFAGNKVSSVSVNKY